MKDSVTYFVLAKMAGLVKIGKSSNDPEKRLAGLQVGAPERLEVVLVLPNRPPFEERQMHQRFSTYRKHGEWFEYRGELLKFIKNKQNNPQPTATDDLAMAVTEEQEHYVQYEEACVEKVRQEFLIGSKTYQDTPYGVNPGWLQWTTYASGVQAHKPGRLLPSRPRLSTDKD